MKTEIYNAADEEYVVLRAKNALQTDPYAAKAWMITAKTLYPNNFTVHFEAYKMEKEAKNVKEAAKCFSYLLENFQEEKFWKEVETVIAALRSENDANDVVNQFLCDMFRHISTDVQHKLLLLTADRCEDAIEHCKLLLLLLQRFPMTIPSHGPRLVDTLLSAEKHSHANNQPVNIYRKLLICDLVPLLASENVSCELSSKLLFKLLHKGTEYYLCYIYNKTNIKDTETKIDKPWQRLFDLLEIIGKHLGWETYLTNFKNNWSKENYWQKILTFCQTHKILSVDDHVHMKQLLYCSTIFFLYCLDDYKSSLSPDASPGQVQTSFVLIEAFTDTSLSNPSLEPKSKRRRTDSESSTPIITVDKNENKNIANNFLMASNCWDLLHSSEIFTREYIKLHNHLKLDSILEDYLIDYALYKKCYDEAVAQLQPPSGIPDLTLSRHIRLANLFYLKKSYGNCFEHILAAVQLLNSGNLGSLSTQLVIGGNQRHLHYLPLTLNGVLQFCVKLLIRCIKHTLIYNDLVIGNLLVLIQLDWPLEEDFLPFLMNQIQQRGSFSYMLFQTYIINIDILEELSYLWSERGGGVTLDILPHLGQRRIGTRGADKGVKEEIKQTIKRQISRNNDRLDQLLIKFITQQRGHIQQFLM
ncbi:integrator complex subunit 10 isoform X2 [Agrilus planipennis]|uniref:Integrator complex subunit 10 n=1 Tax=Agrilus planipennis TaxID=224129 RepID=A0A1W4XA57_AGRPL|nr:integrator complex subunit 10 isoform X2 [Agrilus planipennis]